MKKKSKSRPFCGRRNGKVLWTKTLLAPTNLLCAMVIFLASPPHVTVAVMLWPLEARMTCVYSRHAASLIARFNPAGKCTPLFIPWWLFRQQQRQNISVSTTDGATTTHTKALKKDEVSNAVLTTCALRDCRLALIAH